MREAIDQGGSRAGPPPLTEAGFCQSRPNPTSHEVTVKILDSLVPNKIVG